MTTHTHEAHDRAPVDTSSKPDVLRRLAYIDGHLQGVRRMIEDDKYCVDVLKQTYAVRRAIEKLEARILEGAAVADTVRGARQRANALDRAGRHAVCDLGEVSACPREADGERFTGDLGPPLDPPPPAVGVVHRHAGLRAG